MMMNISAALAVAMMLTVNPANASDCAPLPDDMKCHAEAGDPRAMYLVGRDAYDRAREDGDFTEARMWAIKAWDAKFFPAAKMLFKMVHMQVGEGNHTNLVEGHAWLTMAIDSGRGTDLVSWKRRLEARMTPAQIAEANQLVQQ